MIPTRKVGSGMLAGALTVILSFILARAGVDLPADVASAVTVVLSLGTAYLVPEDVPTGDHASEE